MNLITSLVVAFSFAATVLGTKNSVKFAYKQNANLVYSEAYWQDEACFGPSSISVFAGDGFFKQKGTKKVQFKAAEVYGTFYSDCTETSVTLTDLYLFDEATKLTFGGLDNATVSIAATAYIYTSPCTVETYVDEEFGYSYTSYSCSEGTSSEETFTLDLFTKTAGGDYTEISKGIRKGPGFVTKYKSSSKCKEESSSTFSNVAVGGVPFTVEEEFGYGDICKVKEGYSERYYFS
jgi:hypothetical protein